MDQTFKNLVSCIPISNGIDDGAKMLAHYLDTSFKHVLQIILK